MVSNGTLTLYVRKALEKVSSENTVRDELKKGDSLTAVFEKHKIL